MNVVPLVQSFVGGTLIGASASIAYVGQSRTAGISGILGAVVDAPTERSESRRFELAFLLGLVGVGALVGHWMPAAVVGSAAPMARVIAAGLLVGFGTRVANGCTSGHGVCGISRRSPRSLAATATFLSIGMLTVGVHRLLLGVVP